MCAPGCCCHHQQLPGCRHKRRAHHWCCMGRACKRPHLQTAAKALSSVGQTGIPVKCSFPTQIRASDLGTAATPPTQGQVTIMACSLPPVHCLFKMLWWLDRLTQQTTHPGSSRLTQRLKRTYAASSVVSVDMSVSIDTPAHAPLGVVETPIRGQDALQVVGAPLLLQGKLLQASMSAGCYSGRVHYMPEAVHSNYTCNVNEQPGAPTDWMGCPLLSPFYAPPLKGPFLDGRQFVFPKVRALLSPPSPAPPLKPHPSVIGEPIKLRNIHHCKEQPAHT